MEKQLKLNFENNFDLKSVAVRAYEDWERTTPPIKAAYDLLMNNEDFWDYPEHYTFSRVPGWTVLGSA